ncbi:MAG TPA: hypothetical protein VFF48_12845 [Brevundimonas sp.]|nr:hypothetical protein [Brevundimonas sp.]
MSTRVAALLGLALGMAAGSASACTLILDPPRSGETMEQVAIRMERAQQRQMGMQASHVFLGRVVGGGTGGYFEPVLAIKGGSPPRRVPAFSRAHCEPSEPAAGELRIVFSQRLGRADYPWRPWRWGDGVLLGSRRPAEVKDRDLAAALRRAVGNG